jgi:hemoglobin
MRIRSAAWTLVLATSLAACGAKSRAGGGAGSAVAPKTLYDRLGGKDAITGLVEDFIANVSADKRINLFFNGADVPGFKQKLSDQLCEVTGGPCKYTGKDMHAAHAGMEIKNEELDYFVEDFAHSLDKFKVVDPERKELLAALGRMRGAIVSAQ